MPTKENPAKNQIQESYNIFGKTYIVLSNGDVLCNGNVVSNGYHFPKCAYEKSYAKTITMCINISPVCNLRCKYCYRLSDGPEFSFEEIKRYIDCITAIYPKAERYIVDLSGTGEPLMRLPLLIKVAKYCQELSNKYVREFLPTLACNGTLLTKEVVEQLQEAGILFGVSLDGDKDMHDRNRVFENGQGSFDIVKNNLKNIKNNATVGVALTYSTPELLKAFKAVYPLAPTVSMKPVRYTNGNEFNADEVCASYTQLVEFLLNETVNGNHNYIFSLIRGQDYFGKFLKRVVANEGFYGRCDVGICRFALAYDKKIYGCPAAAGIKECELGDLEHGIDESKMQYMWQLIRNDECENCLARGACGGECIIVSYNKFKRLDKLDPTMCKLKKHMYILAVHFYQTLLEQNPAEAHWLENQVKEESSYTKPDFKLIDAVNQSNGKYTFTQLKRIKDNNKREFEKIYNQLKQNIKPKH